MSKKTASTLAASTRTGRKVGLERWNELNTARSGLMSRLRGYASVTLPVLLLPDNIDQTSSSIQYDWTSMGAQAVNNLSNRFALNLFRPGVPFFRLDASPALQKQLVEQGAAPASIREILVEAEQQGMRVMDREALRPQIVSAFEQLIVLGNTLMDTEESLDFINLDNYVLRRSLKGKAVELLTHYKVLRDELEDDVAAVVTHKREDEYVEFVKHYRFEKGRWYLKQYVDQYYIPGKDQDWSEDTFPLHPLSWRLAKGQNYGTGLVEDYSGDFSTLSNLSESEVKLALLMSDYRWLVSYASGTNPEDFKRTRTGDAMMGKEGDVAIVSAGAMGQNLQYVSASAERVVRRIGAGFMLGTAITRDAERVTAEEVRQQVQELEVALGGAYSRLAVDMQLPIVKYLMAKVKVSVGNTSITPTIVTGMDALSRNAEAQQLDAFVQRVGTLNGVPDDVRARLKLGEILSTMAAASGLASTRFVLNDQEAAAQAQAQQAQATEAAATQGLVDAGSKAIAEGAKQ